MKRVKQIQLMNKQKLQILEIKDYVIKQINYSCIYMKILIYFVNGKMMKDKKVLEINHNLEFCGFIEEFQRKDLIGRDQLKELTEMELRKASHYLAGLDC